MYNNYIQKIKKSRIEKLLKPLRQKRFNNFFCYIQFFLFCYSFHFILITWIILHKLFKVNVYLQLRAFEKHQKLKKALILLLKSFKKFFSFFISSSFFSLLYLQSLFLQFLICIYNLVFNFLFSFSKEIYIFFLLIRLLYIYKILQPFLIAF